MTKNTFEPLIVIPSPRDLKITQDAIENDLPDYDRLWVKYYPEHIAYGIIRQYFLDDSPKRYSHLAILPDDLLVTRQVFEQLVQDIADKDYPVVSGYCNLDATPERAGLINICVKDLITAKRETRLYMWPREQDVLDVYIRERNPPQPIIKVMFSGFPLMFIRRDVVEKITFKSDAKANGYQFEDQGCCFDVTFCEDCHNLNIPIHVDLRCGLKHLKIADGIIEGNKVGVSKPIVILQEKTVSNTSQVGSLTH